ncbi:MAG: hypothetical protein IJT46_01025 [Bacteroidaceae bacterium]|nr:hypothetical protein [Bacteroidaceae bacterium]
MIDCAQYGKSFTELTQNGMARSAHCVPSGYLYMAYEVCTYIDWIIRHNMDDFMDIAFVRKAVEYDPSGTPINP